MRSSILHFFLLILKILFNLATNAVYKYSRFSKTLLKKNLEFFLRKKVDLILFFLCFILLLFKINSFI